MRTHAEATKVLTDNSVAVNTEEGESDETCVVQCPFCPRSFNSEQAGKAHMAVHGISAADIYTQYR